MKTIKIEPTKNSNRVYFIDRNGKIVYSNIEDVTGFLSLSQQEIFFLNNKSIYAFKVPDSTINDLEKYINFPA